MTPARRHSLLFVLLVASAGIVAWDRLRAKPVGVAAAVARPAGKATAPSAMPTRDAAPAIAKLRPRTDYLAEGVDAFPALNPPAPSTVAAPPPQAMETPPRPTAPPIPFTVIGKKLEGGTWEVYLAKGELTYVVRQGDVVADDYRVSTITPTQMTLLYLPLNEQQTLQTGTTFQ